jgi:hypothetical protein
MARSVFLEYFAIIVIAFDDNSPYPRRQRVDSRPLLNNPDATGLVPLVSSPWRIPDQKMIFS